MALGLAPGGTVLKVPGLRGNTSLPSCKFLLPGLAGTCLAGLDAEIVSVSFLGGKGFLRCHKLYGSSLRHLQNLNQHLGYVKG